MTIEGDSAIARTSPDGTTWAELGRSDTVPVTGEMRLQFAASTTQSVAAPGELHLDNVNSGAGLCE